MLYNPLRVVDQSEIEDLCVGVGSGSGWWWVASCVCVASIQQGMLKAGAATLRVVHLEW